MVLRSYFEKLRDEQVRVEFNKTFLGLLKAWDYTVITVCIDKRSTKKSTPSGGLSLTTTAWKSCLSVTCTFWILWIREEHSCASQQKRNLA